MFYFTIFDRCDDGRLFSFCTKRFVGKTKFSEHNRFYFMNDKFKFLKIFEGHEENILEDFHKDILI